MTEKAATTTSTATRHRAAAIAVELGEVPVISEAITEMGHDLHYCSDGRRIEQGASSIAAQARV